MLVDRVGETEVRMRAWRTPEHEEGDIETDEVAALYLSSPEGVDELAREEQRNEKCR